MPEPAASLKRHSANIPAELRLPFAVLSSYLFFLSRRPISESNRHYLERCLAGLRSLSGLFAASSQPELAEVARLLNAITPANFGQRARQLQLLLLAFAHRPLELPADYVQTASSPGPSFFTDARRVALILGPAIGIGDEIICFSIPGWLRKWRPDLHLTVWTGYEGLWNGVEGVDDVRSYWDHSQLLTALLSEPQKDGLVLLADFEKPRLDIAMTTVIGSGRFVELSLGGNSAVALDGLRRWLHRMPASDEHGLNYYVALRKMIEWLSIPTPRAKHAMRPAKPQKPVQLFLSPFTSKSTPSMTYWSRLATGLLANQGPGDVQVLIDAGPNIDTARFASQLARSIATRCPSPVRVASTDSGWTRTLTLSAALAAIEASDAVLCADSYSAHAASRAGAVTLVMATAGLERWRVPADKTFYFDVQSPPEQTIPALCGILGLCFGWSNPAVPMAGNLTRAVSLVSATRRLRSVLDRGIEASGQLRPVYEDFLDLYRGYLHELQADPGLNTLARDSDYARKWRLPEDLPADGRRTALLEHLDHSLAWWENTNLYKLLAILESSGMTNPPIEERS